MGLARHPRLWLGGAIAALGALGVLALWLWAIHWTPARAQFPVQGAWLDAGSGTVEWTTLKATGPGGHGADFVYLTASEGAGARDPAFEAALDAARAVGLKAGAVHVYDVCAPGDAQAQNFVTVVPRDKRMMPAAIAFDGVPACANPPGDAAIDSELTTFLNEVERHLGRPVVLMVSAAAEARWHFAARIDRNAWVAGNYRVPAYVARPFVLWTANDRLRVAGVARPVRWVVVRP